MFIRFVVWATDNIGTWSFSQREREPEPATLGRIGLGYTRLRRAA